MQKFLTTFQRLSYLSTITHLHIIRLQIQLPDVEEIDYRSKIGHVGISFKVLP